MSKALKRIFRSRSGHASGHGCDLESDFQVTGQVTGVTWVTTWVTLRSRCVTWDFDRISLNIGKRADVEENIKTAFLSRFCYLP